MHVNILTPFDLDLYLRPLPPGELRCLLATLVLVIGVHFTSPEVRRLPGECFIDFQKAKERTKGSNYSPFSRDVTVLLNRTIDMTLQKLAICIMGVYGEISHFLSDPAEIWFLVV